MSSIIRQRFQTPVENVAEIMGGNSPTKLSRMRIDSRGFETFDMRRQKTIAARSIGERFTLTKPVF